MVFKFIHLSFVIIGTVHELDVILDLVLFGHFTWDLFKALMAHEVRASSDQLTRLIVCEISLFALHLNSDLIVYRIDDSQGF